MNRFQYLLQAGALNHLLPREKDRIMIESSRCPQCGQPMEFDYEETLESYRAFAICTPCNTREEF